MPIPYSGDGSTTSAAAVSVEIAFDTEPFDSDPVWTDVTDYVDTGIGVSITRGRSDETSTPSPGTCTFTLRNSDSRFTPGDTAGPYGTGVKVRRKVRVSVGFGSVVYRRFTGYITTLSLEWPGGVTESSVVRVTATDLLGVLASMSLRHSHIETILQSAPVAAYPLTERHSPGHSEAEYDQRRLRRVWARGGGTVRFGEKDGYWPADPDLRTVFIKNGVDGSLSWSGLTAVVDYQSATTTVGFGGWIKYLADAPSQTVMLGSLQIDGTWSLAIELTSANATKALLDDYAGNTGAVATSTRSLADGRWHYVYATYTTSGQGVCSIRIDNEAAVSSTAYGVGYPTIGATGQLSVGCGFNGTDSFAYAMQQGWLSHWSVWVDSTASTLDSSLIVEDGRRDSQSTSRASDRIEWLLDRVNFPTADRNLDIACSDVPSSSLETSSALAYATSVADSDMGVFFVLGDGNAAFHSRARRWDAASSCTLSWHDTDETWVSDIDSVVNIAEVSYKRNGGGTIRKSDLNSRVTYGKRGYALSTEVKTAGNAHGLAEMMLAQWATPTPRLSTFTWDLLTGPDAADNAAALALDIGDLFTAGSLPEQAHAASAQLWVEGMSEVIARDRWSVTFNTSPHFDVMPNGVWRLDTSTLGTDTYLGF